MEVVDSFGTFLRQSTKLYGVICQNVWLFTFVAVRVEYVLWNEGKIILNDLFCKVRENTRI